MKTAPAPGSAKSDFLDSIQKGVLLGAAVLALILPPAGAGSRKPESQTAALALSLTKQAPHRRADFGDVVPTDEVRQLANWSAHVGDHQNKPFVILDKKDARVYVFDSTARLTAETPALLGYAVGDDNAPGIGTKPIAEVLPEERTTPAGRFVAEIGMNARNEDVVWVDYDAAVSMHRVLTTNPEERRLERLATPTSQDNRVSYGCINLPVAFFEQVLTPLVRREGAIIYVLPETRSPQQVFGSFDVDRPPPFAQR